MKFKICNWVVVINGRMLGRDHWNIAKGRIQNLRSWTATLEARPFACTLGVAACSFTFVRMAESVAEYGPVFLVVYTLLSALLGSLSVLELGLGQFSQQGATAVWRAIPVLRGFTFVKLLCSTVLAVCTCIRVSLAVAYAVRSAVADLPLSDCTQLTMTANGYFQNNTLGTACAMRTFLKPIGEDSFWFSVMAIIIFVVWILLPIWSITFDLLSSFGEQWALDASGYPEREVKPLYNVDTGLKHTLTILTIISLVLSIALSISLSTNELGRIFDKWMWREFASSDLWFSVVWQIFLSNRIGLAYLDSIGGTLYFKSDVLFYCRLLIGLNVLIGWLGVFLWHCLTPGVTRDVTGVGVLLWLYDAAVVSGRSRVWTTLSFTLLLFSSIASMMTLLYPIFRSLSKSFKYQWKLVAILYTTLCMFSSIALYHVGFGVITFLEQIAVPLIVCTLVFLQVLAFTGIYGFRKLQSDLQFMLARRISKHWTTLWLISAVVAAGMAAWRLTDYVIGLTLIDSMIEVVLLVGLAGTSVLLILIWSFIMVAGQDEYDCWQKVTSSFMPSREWGPVVPILRHLWIQWTSRPLSEDLMAQVRIHRSGSTVMQTRSHSVGTSSRKSSLRDYPKRYEYNDKRSENSSGLSIEEFAEYRASNLDQLTGSKTSSSDRSSRGMGSPDSAYSVSAIVVPKTSKEEDVSYGQIKQMFY